MADSIRTIADTEQGPVQGARTGNITAFLAVPFAAPPTGKLRFQPPAPAPGWKEVRDATTPGPVPAQNPSRLGRVMGESTLAQSEDCLSLNIVTPGVDEQRRPVMVWLYGGAFVSGGNALAWYDGTGFARDHELVFVGVNYRLGAFGFLDLDGVGPPNVGLMDQIAALEWVRRNISNFGGDPERVTLAGQSAGALSAFALLATKTTGRLYHQVILQSGRYNALASRDESRSAAQQLLELAGVSADELRALDASRLLELQGAHIWSNASFGVTSTPYRPCTDGDLIPFDLLPAAVAGAQGKAVMLGWTRDELSAFFAGTADMLAASTDDIEAAFRSQWGANWEAGLAWTRSRHPGAKPDRLMDLGLNECMFAGSSIAFCEHLAHVQPPWVYRFDWAAPDNPFGACHCIDLPFVFNNHAAWDAPMLAGAATEELQALGQTIQRTWAAFVHHGDPNHDGIPPWPRYEHNHRWALRIDRIIETAADLAAVAVAGRPWPERVPLPPGRADSTSTV